MKNAILLENIRSTLNVGSIFRIADATNTTVVLVGYTPQPIDRFGRINQRLHKTALGAEETVEWEHFSTTKEALEKYKKSHTILALEQTAQAISYTKIQTQEKPFLMIVGNEKTGVENNTLRDVKTHIVIPMKGKKESLNVLTAATVVLFHITK